MTGIKKMIFYAVLSLFISGCVAASKTMKSTTTVPEGMTPIVKEGLAPKTVALSGPSSGAPGTPQIVEDPAHLKQTRMTYSQIMALLSEFFDMQPTEERSGKSGFLGSSENGLVTLEIAGDKRDVLGTSMKLNYPKKIDAANADLNRAMMLRFLRNTVPEFEDWLSRTKDILDKFYSMPIGSIEEDKIAVDGKIIEILYDKNTDSIILTVSRK